MSLRLCCSALGDRHGKSAKGYRAGGARGEVARGTAEVTKTANVETSSRFVTGTMAMTGGCAVGLRRVALFRRGRLPFPPTHEWARYCLPHVPSAAHACAGGCPAGSGQHAPDRHLVFFVAAARSAKQFFLSASRRTRTSHRLISPLPRSVFPCAGRSESQRRRQFSGGLFPQKPVITLERDGEKMLKHLSSSVVMVLGLVVLFPPTPPNAQFGNSHSIISLLKNPPAPVIT